MQPGTRSCYWPLLGTLMLMAMSVVTADAQEFFVDDAAADKLPDFEMLNNSPQIVQAGYSVTKSGLTLKQLQEMAFEYNPTIEQAQAVVRSAYGRKYQAGRKPNPTFGYTAAEIGNDGKSGQQGLFIRQEFVRGNKLELSVATAGNAAQQADKVREVQEHRVENAVRREYYAVLAAQRMSELANEFVRIARETKDVTQARLNRQEGTKIELLQGQIELEGALLILNTAEQQYEAAWRRLQAIVAAPDLSPTRLDGEIERGIPELTWEGTLNRLIETSPQLMSAQFGVARARTKLLREEAQPTPNIFLQAAAVYDASTQTQIANVQVGFPIPYNNRNRGNITVAQAELVRAAREVDRIELSLRYRLADTFRNYQTGRRQVERYRDAILPASRESLELSRSAFDGGELGYLQLLTAQRTYTLKSREYVEALSKLWKSVVELDGLLLVEGLSAPVDIGGR